jgi:hypothetical protein
MLDIIYLTRMYNVKISLAATLFFSLSSISCMQNKIQDPDIKYLISKSVVNPRFKMRMGIHSNVSDKFYILTSKPITDSLVVEGNTYLINPKSSEINPRKLLVMRQDSINSKERKLIITHIYYPSLTTLIRGEFTFTLQNNNWSLKEHGTSIADGHFKLPKY